VTSNFQPSDTEFDAYATDYHAELNAGLRLSGEDSVYFAKGRVDWLRLRLGQLGHITETVLDYGCGTGSTVPLLLELPGVQRVFATDASAALLETATRQHRSDRASFVPLSTPLAHVADLAYCNGVFHHIAPARRAEALAFVVRALRPGGLFAFWENNPWNPGTRLIMRRIPFDRDAVTLSAPAARRLLTEGGLEVVGNDFTFFFPASLRRVRRLEPYLRRVPLGAQYLVLARKPLTQSSS
jgi:SAM-dependent methyltransferase